MSESEAPGSQWHSLPDCFHDLAAKSLGSVLLETAKFDRENFRSFLFIKPVCQLIANSVDEIPRTLHEIDRYIENGWYVAGFVSYECGEFFQNIKSPPRKDSEDPLISMGVFEAPFVFDHRSGHIEGDLNDFSSESGTFASESCCVEDFDLLISEQEYEGKLCQIRKYLDSGDTYQVNFTDRVEGGFTGSPRMLYQRLLRGQPVSYAAFVDCGSRQILSFSPELFYRTADGRILVKPMKGTWPRGATEEEDAKAAAMLREDEKNRAEHVMIVDLLRSDVGRVSRMGSVRVDRLMEVERYRTLHQMTSTVSGVLDPSKTPSEVFTSLFPSGSVTGAPKRRTMEIIRELERGPRGVYAGAIGWWAPNNQACFSVAIRTMTCENQRFTLGVGGGITAGSDAADEYAECKLKASFLRHSGIEFSLIETMLADGANVPLLRLHLDRLRRSSAYFNFPFDEQGLRTQLDERLGPNLLGQWRVRLTLNEQGHSDIQISPQEEIPWRGRILLSSERTGASDVFLRHKTTRRDQYQSAFDRAQNAGFDEVLFMNHDGFVTEGAISNIFLEIDGDLVTPDTTEGLLPGVYREHLLEAGQEIQIRSVTLDDLVAADHIWLCNALRGRRIVHAIVCENGSVVWEEGHRP